MSETSQDESPEELQFLENQPPPWASHGLAYLIISMFVIAILASSLIEVPEAVSGPFVLIPTRGTDPVRASEDGFISDVRIVEGQIVNTNDVLFTIHSEVVGNRSAEFESSRTSTQSVSERMGSTRLKYDSDRRANEVEQQQMQEKRSSLQKRIELKEEQLKLSGEILESYDKLMKEGIASRVEYNNKKLELNKIALELKELQTEYAETDSSFRKLQYESTKREAEFHGERETLSEEKRKNEIRMEALNRELENSKGSVISILAPCSGTILRLVMKSRGSVVQQGETLCDIACSGEKLQAELVVPQIGLSRIRAGHGVKLLYDAFPYQRYGVRFGSVRWVSPASVEAKQDAVFPVRIDLNDQDIMVQGQARPLRPGMRGTAQVVVDRRTLISYAFSPIRQLREMLARPPEKKI